MKLSTFIQTDVIIKQGDVGDYFYVIIDGMVEVRKENKDFKFFDHESTLQFLGDSVPKIKEESRWTKCKKFFKRDKVKKGPTRSSRERRVSFAIPKDDS